MGLLAALVIEALYFFPRNPFVSLDGMRRINADHDPTYWAFMAGRFASHFYTYYLVAYLLKEPVPAIVLTAVGAWALLRPGALPRMDRAFLFLPPAFLFLAYSLYSDNLGFRYMIPALPFLHLVGGSGLAFLVKEAGALRRLCAVVRRVWAPAAGGGMYPRRPHLLNQNGSRLADPPQGFLHD